MACDASHNGEGPVSTRHHVALPTRRKRIRNAVMGIGFVRVLRAVSLCSAVASMPIEARADVMCAIDMGSNSFRRIVASFENGR